MPNSTSLTQVTVLATLIVGPNVMVATPVTAAERMTPTPVTAAERMAPAPVKSDEACYYCYPIQGPDGWCRRTPQNDDDGWVDCKNIPSGGCDFVGFDRCDAVLEFAGFATDELDLGPGFVLTGRFLHEGVFAHRTCDGRQTGVTYSLPEKEVRLESASAITITLSGHGPLTRVAQRALGPHEPGT